MSEGQQPPILLIAGGLFLLVGAFGWAFAAAQYAHGVQGWRTQGVAGSSLGEGGTPRPSGQSAVLREAARSLADFVGNAFRQIPSAPAVIGYNVRNRLWLVGLFALLELGVIAIAWWMFSLEKQWSRPVRRRRNKYDKPISPY